MSVKRADADSRPLSDGFEARIPAALPEYHGCGF
jgi:hypothetical protein